MAEQTTDKESETVILVGPDAVKAVEVTEKTARVGAYAVRFATEEEKDLSGEYFTKATWFGKNDGNGADVLLNHGEPLGDSAFLKKLADYTFDCAKSLKDDIGIFMEVVLDLSDDFQKAVFELVQGGKLSWSTGSASHVVKKAPGGEIKRWPIVEVSFTPCPCEPRLPAIQPLKSALAFTAEDMASLKAAFPEPGTLNPEPSPPVDNSATATGKATPPHTMSESTVTEPKKSAPEINLEAERKAWQKTETERKSAIRAEAKEFQKTAGVSQLLENALDNSEVTVEHFRKSLIAQLKSNAAEKDIRTQPSDGVEIVHEPGDARKGAYSDFRGVKSLGESLISHEGYKAAIKSGNHRGQKFELPNTKATLLTSTGGFTSYERPPGIVMVEQQRLTVRDLLSQGQTNANSIRYQQEDTYTNAATTVAEEGLKPDASWDLSEVDAPIRKIAVIGRVSDESFADYPYLQTYVDGRLRFMLKEREEAQFINGNGAGSNLTGLLQTSGIQTQARGVDTHGDAIFKAIFDKVFAIGRFQADGIVIHPTDYSTLARAKDANEQYMGGGYFYGPYGNGMGSAGIKNIWGIPTVVTTAITQGTALVGAFKMGAMIFDRMGVTVDTTNSDGEDFRYNRIAIRVEERTSLVVWRPTAFAKITGL